MIKPAKIYETELNTKLQGTMLDPYYKWWHMTYKDAIITVESTFWSKTQIVGVHDGKVTSYFSAIWDRPGNYVDNFICANFCRDHKVWFAADMKAVFNYLINEENAKKIRWVCVKNNPINKSYEKLVKKFGGRIIGTERYGAHCCGHNYDLVYYEWINDYYVCDDCGYKTKKDELVCKKCGSCLMSYVNPFETSVQSMCSNI